MIDISIAIVAFHNEEDVENAVCSIMEHTADVVSKKIYIIDNSIEPTGLAGLEGRWPGQLEYLPTGENLGFGRGHNYVLERLDSKYHAIVNPDILLIEDSLSILMDFLEKTGADVAVPRLINEEGKLQEAYRRDLTVLDMGIRMFFESHFKKRQAYHTMQDMDYGKPFQVPFAQGSFMVMPSRLFWKLGGFDERYFMYMEDADFCQKVNFFNGVWYCPDTSVIHKWERGSHKDKNLRKVHIRSMVDYFQKWGWKLW